MRNLTLQIFVFLFLLPAYCARAQAKKVPGTLRDVKSESYALSDEEKNNLPTLSDIKKAKMDKVLENNSKEDALPQAKGANSPDANSKTNPAAPQSEFGLMDDITKGMEKAPPGGYQTEKKVKKMEENTSENPQSEDYWSFRKKEWEKRRAEENEEKKEDESRENYTSPNF